MKEVAKKILAPVQLDAASRGITGQIAELAATHKAEIHLLHIADIADCRGHLLNFFTRKGVEDYHRLTKVKTDILNTWKRWLEKEYRVTVHATVQWSSWQTGIIHHAKKIGADIIALAPDVLPSGTFTRNAVQSLIDKSPCQVITFFSGEISMQQWKQVVIPVANFIPEQRIQTISGIAKTLHLKVHLVTVPGRQNHSRDTEFFYLTETLKRLKPAGNIPVECRCLTEFRHPTNSFLHYARNIGADILMTGRC